MTLTPDVWRACCHNHVSCDFRAQDEVSCTLQHIIWSVMVTFQLPAHVVTVSALTCCWDRAQLIKSYRRDEVRWEELLVKFLILVNAQKGYVRDGWRRWWRLFAQHSGNAVCFVCSSCFSFIQALLARESCECRLLSDVFGTSITVVSSFFMTIILYSGFLSSHFPQFILMAWFPLYLWSTCFVLFCKSLSVVGLHGRNLYFYFCAMKMKQ